jgi:hypothetical protein
MQLTVLSESADWKLDIIDSHTEIAPNHTWLHSELGAKKGDEIEYITYLAFLETLSEFGLKVGITVRIELIIDKTTGVAWIDWLGKGPNRHNNNDPIPGYANLRRLLAQIAKRHQICSFRGSRESGMREKFDKPEFRLSTRRL